MRWLMPSPSTGIGSQASHTRPLFPWDDSEAGIFSPRSRPHEIPLLPLIARRPMTDKQPTKGPALPVSPPTRDEQRPRPAGAPDLHLEEIEEKHVPKDRNIFDK